MPKKITMKIVSDLQSIPPFKTEADESGFWANHRLSDELLARMGPFPDGLLPPARAKSRLISIRIDEELLARAKELAGRRRVAYQTLLKQFIQERVDREWAAAEENEPNAGPGPTTGGEAHVAVIDRSLDDAMKSLNSAAATKAIANRLSEAMAQLEETMGGVSRKRESAWRLDRWEWLPHQRCIWRSTRGEQRVADAVFQSFGPGQTLVFLQTKASSHARSTDKPSAASLLWSDLLLSELREVAEKPRVPGRAKASAAR
jgi:hypothetical protein